MSAKTRQLQIRVTPAQKAALKRQAAAAGLDVSSYVLARALPNERGRFVALLRQLREESERRYALAELNDFLHRCATTQFAEAVARADIAPLSPYLQNYVAAMIEQAAEQKQLPPPAWVRDVTPLDAPHFASSLVNLRLHLLRASPVPFKRRNIFIDAGVGARV